MTKFRLPIEVVGYAEVEADSLLEAQDKILDQITGFAHRPEVNIEDVSATVGVLETES